MGSFLFIIACCLALLMIAVFYEFANIDIWLHQPQSHGESTTTQKVPMWSFMMRTYMELLVGVISCGWTLGPRFSNLWKNRFCLRPVERKLPTVNYPQSTFSTASYQTVCPQNSMISLSTKAGTNVRKYQPPMHIYRKVRVYKSPSQSISLTGNETVLWNWKSHVLKLMKLFNSSQFSSWYLRVTISMWINHFEMPLYKKQNTLNDLMFSLTVS